MGLELDSCLLLVRGVGLMLCGSALKVTGF